MREIRITLAEAKARLSELTELAARGETVVITKRGRAVARIIQAEAARRPIDLEKLRDLTANLPVQSEESATFIRRLREGERY